VLSLAKKKFDKIFISANAGTPYPKNFKAAAVISTSFLEKDPYPNSAFTISFDAKINPKLAGIENRSESSKDLFWILEIFSWGCKTKRLIFFFSFSAAIAAEPVSPDVATIIFIFFI